MILSNTNLSRPLDDASLIPFASEKPGEVNTSGKLPPYRYDDVTFDMQIAREGDFERDFTDDWFNRTDPPPLPADHLEVITDIANQLGETLESNTVCMPWFSGVRGVFSGESESQRLRSIELFSDRASRKFHFGLSYDIKKVSLSVLANDDY